MRVHSCRQRQRDVGAATQSAAASAAAMGLFVVPTVSFNLLYVLVIVRLARRELVWIDVTAHPTAEWLAQQITEALPWNDAPRYLIRDRDARLIRTMRHNKPLLDRSDRPSP